STSSQEEMERSNVVGTRRLLEAAAPGQLERAVHMSSTSIYGEEVQLPLPVREDTEPRPSRGYGKAKWGAEQEVWAQGRAGLAVTVLRPVSVYGPGNVKLLASAILDVAIERRAGLAAVAVHAVPLEQRLVHIDDVVNAAVHLSTHPDAAGRAYNVVGPTYPTNHEVARVIADAFAMTVELDDDPACGLGQPERVATHAAMVAGGMVPAILLTNPRFRFMGKANRNNRLSVDALLATGYHFAHGDLALGIERVIAWYRSHKWVV
ncbi:MAG: NAD-dependent epimerase/dehydratase family protein, partial [Acidimicrobiales bacterium]